MNLDGETRIRLRVSSLIYFEKKSDLDISLAWL